MIGIKLISTQDLLQSEFKRCCSEYNHLEMYVAWVGNPRNIIPYDHLANLLSVKGYIGIAFDQPSPEGIEYLTDHKYNITIIDSDQTYHPKLYFFKSKNQTALLIGSSNFTYSGFSENIEANVLIEGKQHKKLIEQYLKDTRKLIERHKTIIPDGEWLKQYKQRYQLRQRTLKKSKIKDEVLQEDNLALYPSWLNKVEWEIYLRHIKKGMKRSETVFGENLHEKLVLFIEYKKNLLIPWHPSLFNTIENRRRILGKSGYGWLGHVGASGRIQQLLVNGSLKEKTAITTSINKIAKLEIPIDYDILKKELENLEKLGPTIKVWGRLLAITRPDVYCTISSKYVRESLSNLLHKPKAYFETVNGYIDLLKLIHMSPWYNSTRPKNKDEEQIWLRRVAFLDVIFY